MTDFPPPVLTKRRIRRVTPLQFGKMMGVLYAIMGLFAIPVFLMMSLLAAHLPPQQRVGMLAFGTGFALLAPVLYGAMGFVFGIIGAWIYNLIAKWLGGIEVEIE